MGFFAGALSTYVLFALTTMLDTIINSDESSDTTTLFFWFKIFVSILMGIFIGFILTKMQYIAAAVIGGLIGSILGVGVYQLISWDNFEFLVFCTLLFVILMAILTFKFYDHIIIIFTAIVGIYAFVRGWSLIFGKFPNEYKTLKTISEGEEVEVLWQYWVYLGAIILGWILACVFQFVMRKKRAEK